MKLNKSGINKLYLFVIMLILCCTGIGSAAFVVSIENSGESSINSGGSPSYVAVASLKNGTKWTDYYSVEDALAAAVPGNIIHIYPDSNAVIHGTYDEEDKKYKCVVPSGVTLAIPINVGDTTTGNSIKSTLTSSDTGDKFLGYENLVKNTLTISESVELVLEENSVLDIYGVLSGGSGAVDYASFTNGDCGILYMEANSVITCKPGSRLNSYGFIVETSKNNGSKIVQKGTESQPSKVYVPFVLRDYLGGTILSHIYSNKSKYSFPPFRQFQFMNIQPTLECDYYSEIHVFGSVYASSSHHSMEAMIVGNDTKTCLIQLSNVDTYLITKLNSTEVLDIHIYGDAVMDGLTLSLSGTSITTTDYYFPMSWRQHLELHPFKDGRMSTFYVPYNVTLYPGAYLKVHENAILSATANMNVLDYNHAERVDPYFCDYFYPNTNSENASIKNYARQCYNKPAYSRSRSNATFIVDGIFETTGGFAGRIECSKENAIVKAINSVAVSTYQIKVVTLKKVIVNRVDLFEMDTINNVAKGITEGNTDYVNLDSSTDYVSNSENKWRITQNSTMQFGSDKYTIQEGESLNLTYTSDQTPILSVLNGSNLIDLDPATGVVTAKEGVSGVAIIKGQSGSAYDTCEIEIISKEVLTLSDSEVTLHEGETHTLEVLENSSGKSVTFTSSKENVATVTNDGVITPISKGDTKITATSGSATATCIVTVDTRYTLRLSTESGTQIPANGNPIDIKVELTIELKEGFSQLENAPTTAWALTDIKDTNASITESNNDYAVVTVKEAAGTFTIKANYGFASVTESFTVTKASSGCLVEGTLITMADGTKVPIEDIDSGDMVMAFDHEQGKFVSAPVMLNAHKDEGYKTLTVTELLFDDGTNLKIAHNHALFSLTDMNYVTLDKDNAHEFVGDTFYSFENKEIKLVATRNYTDTVRVYVPFTKGHINCVANGLLTNPGVYANFLTSILTFKENMQVDIDARNKDIEQYGLFKYEDLSMYVNESMFNELNLQYLKIGIGKKMYTMDDVIKYLGLYKKYFE